MSAPGIDAPEAIAAWDADLAAGGDVRGDLDALVRWQQEHGFAIGERVADSVARPRLLRPDGIRRLASEAELVLSALERVERAILDDPARWEPLVGEFGDEERELLEMPAPLTRGDIIARIDGTWTGDRFVFYELNGSVPAGVETTHDLSTLFSRTGTFARVSRSIPLTPFDLERLATDNILAAWRRFGGDGAPRIAIVDFLDEVASLATFRVMSSWMAARDVECEPVDARELEFDGRRLRHDGRPIDLVYRRLGVTDMLGRGEDTEALRRAVRAEAVAMIDPFPMSVLDRKALFAPTTEPDVLRELPAAERSAVQRCIPWTRLLADGNATGPEGERIDLLEYARSHREKLVLKPNHDRAGHGVHVGATMDQPAWERALDEASTGEWVVQAGVPPATARYPLIDDPASLVEVEESTDPFLFSGRFGGVLTRLAPSGLTNISAGGSTTAAFVAGA